MVDNQLVPEATAFGRVLKGALLDAGGFDLVMRS
jgi:hypothetical protein